MMPMQNIFARPMGMPQAPMQSPTASNMMRMPQGGGLQNVFAQRAGAPQAGGSGGMPAAPVSNMMRFDPSAPRVGTLDPRQPGQGQPGGPPMSGPVAMQPQPAPAQTPVPGQPPAPISNMGVGAPGQPPPQNVFAMRPGMAG